MADDLVVREIDWEAARQFARETSTFIRYADFTLFQEATGNLARAYLAVVAEQDDLLNRFDNASSLLEAAQAGVTRLQAQLAASQADAQSWIDKAGEHNEAATQFSADVERLEAQLAAMTAERDEALKEAKIRAHANGYGLLLKWYQDTKAQLTASEAALRKYGRHLDSCRLNTRMETICDCGLTDALAEPGKAGEP